MRSLFLTFVFGWILALGFRAPFIFVLGYIWVDIFVPQVIAHSLIKSLPVSMIFGVCAVGAIAVQPRDSFHRLRLTSWLVISFGVWMTLTLLWAVAPSLAFEKWNWAIKTVLFTSLIPLAIRTRFQVEAMIWTIVLSAVAHCIPFALKVLVSGGGYGRALGLVQGNVGYGESSTLAMVAVSLVPLCLYLIKHQTLFPFPKYASIVLVGFIAAAILTSLGSYARTGLVTLAFLSAYLFITSNRKSLYLVVALLIGITIVYFSGDVWINRMSSIGSGSESSAMGRVAVWKWTFEYVLQHPLGGSFNMFVINDYQMQLANGDLLTVTGKAFHSIYFEILGETGFPGIAIFIAIIGTSFRRFKGVKQSALSLEHIWLRDLATSLQVSFAIVLVGGLFIGIGFQAYLYYFVALSVILGNLSVELKDDKKR